MSLNATLDLPAFLAPLLEDLESADAIELDARLRRALRIEQRLLSEMAAGGCPLAVHGPGERILS